MTAAVGGVSGEPAAADDDMLHEMALAEQKGLEKPSPVKRLLVGGSTPTC